MSGPFSRVEHIDPGEAFIAGEFDTTTGLVRTPAGDVVPVVKIRVTGRWNRGAAGQVTLIVAAGEGLEDLTHSIREASAAAELDETKWKMMGSPLPPEEGT